MAATDSELSIRGAKKHAEGHSACVHVILDCVRCEEEKTLLPRLSGAARQMADRLRVRTVPLTASMLCVVFTCSALLVVAVLNLELPSISGLFPLISVLVVGISRYCASLILSSCYLFSYSINRKSFSPRRYLPI